MWYPSAQEVIALHALLIERTGGSPGILSPGSIEAAVQRMREGPFLSGDDLSVRTALLLRGIAQDHPFVDGNKRTAFFAAFVFLRRNGALLLAAEEEVVGFMLSIARGELPLESIAEWVRNHTRHV